MKNIYFKVSLLSLLLLMPACLKTRSEVGQADQSYLYRKKQSENQKENSRENNKSEGPSHDASAVDQDEVIRNLNGRLEVLENQLGQLQKENAQLNQNAQSDRVTVLQEALTKMEAQIQKLEAEKVDAKSELENTAKLKTSDENLKAKLSPGDTKKSAYDVAEELFARHEWKKAILSYQQFTEDSPKSKLVPDAKYKTGVCFQELGLKDEALAFYEEVSVQYPQSIAGKKAKIRMSKIKKK